MPHFTSGANQICSHIYFVIMSTMTALGNSGNGCNKEDNDQ